MRLPAEPREEAAAGPSGRGASAAAAEPWLQLAAGLQRNCQQFSSNLAKLQCQIGRQLSQLVPVHSQPTAAATAAAAPVASLSQATAAGWGGGASSSRAAGAVTREEVGRATWTFLHTLAAQYPERPTRQQQRDARNLMDILTRMYPCGECARHFREVVRQHPPAVASRADFSLWMCEAHNIVNRQLGKPAFNCALAASRWSSLECGEEEGGRDACSLEVGRRR